MAGTSKWVKISYLIACGIVLQVGESLFPHPIPGVRLGLANISTLLALNFFGFSAGFYVALMRPLIGSLFLGSFLSPAFILSFSGSVVSCFVMWIF
ncbi:MAG: Gx transporter family protein, partial [Elusimicrobiota bacterium]|nr:Gx transporter family protein [Elusimicrobiota bacterium]